jgi:hypothetical protein
VFLVVPKALYLAKDDHAGHLVGRCLLG